VPDPAFQSSNSAAISSILERRSLPEDGFKTVSSPSTPFNRNPPLAAWLNLPHRDLLETPSNGFLACFGPEDYSTADCASRTTVMHITSDNQVVQM